MKMEKPVKEECRWRVARKIVLVQVQRKWGHMFDQEVSFWGFRGTTFFSILTWQLWAHIRYSEYNRGRDGLYYSAPYLLMKV